MPLPKIDVGKGEREEGQRGEANDAAEQKRIDPLGRDRFVRSRRKVSPQKGVSLVDRPLQDHQWRHEQKVLEKQEDVEGHEKSLGPSPTIRDGEAASSESVEHLPVPVDGRAEQGVEALEDFP